MVHIPTKLQDEVQELLRRKPLKKLSRSSMILILFIWREVGQKGSPLERRLISEKVNYNGSPFGIIWCWDGIYRCGSSPESVLSLLRSMQPCAVHLPLFATDCTMWTEIFFSITRREDPTTNQMAMQSTVDGCLRTMRLISVYSDTRQKKADPIGRNVARPTCALTYYSLYFWKN